MTKIQTPLGWLTENENQKLIASGVFTKNHAIITERVEITKNNDQGKLVIKDYFIPVRYYNMKYFLEIKNMEFKKAILEFDLLHDGYNPPYLPEKEGFTSYSKMLTIQH